MSWYFQVASKNTGTIKAAFLAAEGPPDTLKAFAAEAVGNLRPISDSGYGYLLESTGHVDQTTANCEFKIRMIAMPPDPVAPAVEPMGHTDAAAPPESKYPTTGP